MNAPRDLRLIGEAWRIFAENSGTLTLAIFTFSLPANLLLELILYSIDESQQLRVSFQLGGLIGLIVTPLHAAAFFAVAEADGRTHPPSASEVIRAALAAWPRVLAAIIVPSIQVGLAALLFVVPGIVVAVRYSFVEVTAFAQHAAPKRARQESWRLTRGLFWRLFWLHTVFLSAAFVLGLGGAAALESWPEYDGPVPAALLGCVFDLVVAIVFGGIWMAFQSARTQSDPPLPPPIA
ncbi:MAG: hypothetical protein ACR2P8_00655 [Myxococcota bacterium]